MEAFTGNHGIPLSFEDNGKSLYQNLTQELSSGGVITMATPFQASWLPGFNFDPNGSDLVGKHMYAVVGSYIDNSGVGMIELVNPWGINYERGTGDVQLSADGKINVPADALIRNNAEFTFRVGH